MQLGEAEELLRKWRGRVVILLNPEWAEGQSVPSSHTAFVKSFEVVYCFQPIAIQVSIVRVPTSQSTFFAMLHSEKHVVHYVTFHVCVSMEPRDGRMNGEDGMTCCTGFYCHNNPRRYLQARGEGAIRTGALANPKARLGQQLEDYRADAAAAHQPRPGAGVLECIGSREPHHCRHQGCQAASAQQEELKVYSKL